MGRLDFASAGCSGFDWADDSRNHQDPQGMQHRTDRNPPYSGSAAGLEAVEGVRIPGARSSEHLVAV